MNRIPVKSSNIKSIGHDPDTGIMHVEFSSGDIYEYAGITAQEHRMLLTANSVGTHFHQNIRGKKTGRKIDSN